MFIKTGPLRRLYQTLFDFRGGKESQKQITAILETALSLAQSDTDFDRALRVSIARHDPNGGDMLFGTIHHLMNNNRRIADHSAGNRTIAQHLLEDLPRICGE